METPGLDPIDSALVGPLLTTATGTAPAKLFADVGAADRKRVVRRVRVVNTHASESLWVQVAPVGTAFLTSTPGVLVRPTDPPLELTVLGTQSVYIRASAAGTTWDAVAHDRRLVR